MSRLEEKEIPERPKLLIEAENLIGRDVSTVDNRTGERVPLGRLKAVITGEDFIRSSGITEESDIQRWRGKWMAVFDYYHAVTGGKEIGYLEIYPDTAKKLVSW